MTTSIHLENLNLIELNILLGHLRLGEGHLKKRLNKKQFKNLLSLGTLNFEQQANIYSNRAEKSGNVALVLNTVITSTFGAWMGFSGFMGLHLDSLIMLAGITSIALTVSTIVGFFSFRLTALNAQAAINNQKLHNVQLQVLKLIKDKRSEEISSTTNYLNHSLNYIIDHSLLENCTENKLTFLFNDEISFSKWISELSKALTIKAEMINKECIYNFYSDRLLKILNELTGLMAKNLPVKQSVETLYFTKKPLARKWRITTPGENTSFIQILSNPILPNKTVLPPHKSWLRKNFLALIAGIVPTLFGGFASMFVFLAGGPNLAKELGLFSLEKMLKNPSAQLIEFSIAVMLTLYYGASFIYNNYKNYIREHEIEKTKKSIMAFEKEIVELESQFNILGKMKRQTLRIINIYTAIENISLSWANKNKEIENYIKTIGQLKKRNQFLIKELKKSNGKVFLKTLKLKNNA